MNNNKTIRDIIESSSDMILKSKSLSDQIEKTVNLITKSLKNGNKLVIFGNGGSAADAQHMAAEFVGRFMKERKSFPAIALTTDTSIITAIGNDYGFEKIFSRQIESLIKKGDLILAISTSGNSKNVLNGMKTAKQLNAKIISLTGKNSGQMKTLSDIILDVPSTKTSKIQEVHRVIIHIICELVEDNLS